ncbi:MAG TPA: hypothetical protein VNO20_09870 [Solirubrobacterales bacterium]|nr:hypothetical protein [Solirubrobacterales bacterium]
MTLTPLVARAADPPLLRQFCDGKQGNPASGAGGRCVNPRGIAVDPDSGDVYVDDTANRRIQRFTAWGQFLRAWGWDVVASGPGDDTVPPEDQFEVCVPANGDVCKAGINGDGAGQFDGPQQGIAVDSSGVVYVVDGNNARIQKFSSEGDFLLAWGGDVIASGPDDSSNDEVQEVSIASTSGTFKLGFEDPRKGGGKQETGPLPFDASASEVEAALNALSTIAGFAGSVAVTGGPGDASGSSPYAVTFEGDLGGDELPQLSIDRSALGPASIGARLVCSPGLVTVFQAKTIEFQWLRNGSPIPGATSPTYNTTSEDEGRAIQCRITAINPNAASAGIANPVYVAPPVPSTPAPVAGTVTATANKQLDVGSLGGQTLTCSTSGWSDAESFSYRWYRNGVQIPGAIASTYVTDTADLATPAVFQCEATGSNAGGVATSKISAGGTGGGALIALPEPAPREPIAEARMDPPSNVFTVNQGGAPEVCSAADLCKKGVVGTDDGQFGAWPPGSFIAVHPGPPETIYVGDRERIQEFDSEGKYLGDLADPDELLIGNTVQSLAVDPSSGDLYISLVSKTKVEGIASPANVYRLDSTTGVLIDTLEVEVPSAVAVNGKGEVYVVDGRRFAFTGHPANRGLRLLRFGSGGGLIEAFLQQEFIAKPGEFQESIAIATSSACGIDGTDLFVANSVTNDSFIRLYGPPPDPEVCPPPSLPPTIEGQHAFSVGTTDAVVRAGINPHFWPDTAYWVQYGTEDCASGPSACESKALFPGAPLNSGVVDATRRAGVTLSGLEPDTTYHYRFVAESEGSEAGPAIGEGEGLGGSFHTYPIPQDPPSCGNDTFRGGPSASLPECRAYELVSPVEKNSGDVGTDEANFGLSAANGDRATYSSFTSFADPEGAPLSNQYLSSRDAVEGWVTKAIAPPRSSLPLYGAALPANTPQFRSFSSDLCSSWLIGDSLATHVEGAPQGVPNLYRRLECEAANACPFAGQLVPGACHELLTQVHPPGFSRELEAGDSDYIPMVQGFSADGTRTLLRADAVLTPDACKTNPEESKGLYQLYLVHAGNLRLVSVMQNGSPACTHASAGTAQGAQGAMTQSNAYRAISADGTRVFWSMSGSADGKVPVHKNGGAGDEAGPLFVRLNPEGPKGSSSNCATTAPGEACTTRITNNSEARFWGADVHGSTAIYSTGPQKASELFEYDVDARDETLIAKGVLGVAGVSDDATRVYFASSEALAGAGQNSEGAEALAGKPNLYLHERGAGSTFVATLASSDAEGGTNVATARSPITPLPDRRTSRVSPDGMHLAFMSAAPLTGIDNADVQSGEPNGQVFLFDALAANLACISCNPSGAQSKGERLPFDEDHLQHWAASQLPGWESQLHPTRLLSDSGDRLFFESFDSLVLGDTNGRKDVYEWQRAESKGQCAEEGADVYSPEAGGCISLISSGQSSVDSQLIDASASGSDVFFTTTSSLLPQDNGLVDVYDARIGGGFPIPPDPEPICEGEACQGTPTPPDDPTPASSTFQGAGNLTEGTTATKPRCPKGRRAVRKAGKTRCVRQSKERRRGKRANRDRRKKR